jgi:hypothetical protein
MKTLALALTLVTATVQTVGWVECCCIVICKHRNDPCSDCKEKQQKEQQAVADCCEKSHSQEPAPEKRCAHVEPSSEVVAHATALPSVELDLLLDLPLVPLVQVPPAADATLAPSDGIRGSPPLHLLYSVLLI